MSFASKLKLDGKEMNILYASYDLHQEVDQTGRPSSVTRGGQIKLIVESTNDSFFFEWMTNNFERKDGSIQYIKRDTDAKLKELMFKEAYMVNYEEEFDAKGENPLVESFTISAREINFGTGGHVNLWV
ncbi:type VI secretion system tube protein TssD [Flavobacterium sp. '19STA2R22 D10 B1']|uniref:type VI secretion system tube protein TssD n=1 Tax=Flavobacterium aerium TaxID=3037261 RepID=UPI00278C668D|nr:type VI secretion system tube protein TssD [Flavobacterium sp. '19STA2R22 D10 B1']